MNLNIVKTFVIKEFKQIIRDISSILIAFILPLILLFLFGFGVNFDTNKVKIGLVDLDKTNITRDIAFSIQNTRFLDVYYYKTVKAATSAMENGKIRGFVVFPVNFTKEYKKIAKVSAPYKTTSAPQKALKNSKEKISAPDIQIITDGSEPNTAKFVSNYVQGAILAYSNFKKKEAAEKTPKTNKIKTIIRCFYNPALKSTYFVLPGSLAIIMTMTGTVLCALVIAREWERGTMEALLTTEITKSEFILSKYIAYFCLSLISVVFCLFLIIAVFKIPYRGSYFVLFIVSALFMLTGVGQGLLISTLFKDQFISSQIAGTVGFMPSMMLSGLIYEIDSMPPFIRIISELTPAKYYVSSVTSLFLTGTVLKTLIFNSLYMLLFSIVMWALIYINTKERLEEDC